jgi:hypothetical protein
MGEMYSFDVIAASLHMSVTSTFFSLKIGKKSVSAAQPTEDAIMSAVCLPLL